MLYLLLANCSEGLDLEQVIWIRNRQVFFDASAPARARTFFEIQSSQGSLHPSSVLRHRTLIGPACKVMKKCRALGLSRFILATGHERPCSRSVPLGQRLIVSQLHRKTLLAGTTGLFLCLLSI